VATENRSFCLRTKQDAENVQGDNTKGQSHPLGEIQDGLLGEFSLAMSLCASHSPQCQLGITVIAFVKHFEAYTE